ncbi:MAG: ABC transporter permease, partial [Methanosarcinales archaeon]|nr:ABC transporter permease [Methanosarcinales archaeon]
MYGEEGRAIDKDITFMIAGRLKPTGTDTDDQAFIDINIARELTGKDVYDGIIVKLDKSGQT